MITENKDVLDYILKRNRNINIENKIKLIINRNHKKSMNILIKYLIKTTEFTFSILFFFLNFSMNPYFLRILNP